MSQTHTDTNYGTRKPEEVEKYSDQVVINRNIREVPITDAETGETVMTYIADAETMTYQEYSTVQDRIIAQQAETIAQQGLLLAEQSAINDEHDELFGLIIEGEL